jgi:hypothetical protein
MRVGWKHLKVRFVDIGIPLSIVPGSAPSFTNHRDGLGQNLDPRERPRNEGNTRWDRCELS